MYVHIYVHKYIHPGYAKHLKCINIVKINKGNSPINISLKVAKVKKKKSTRGFLLQMTFLLATRPFTG